MKREVSSENQIIYYDPFHRKERVIYGAYSIAGDVTTIFEDLYDTKTGLVRKTSLKGFYFGEPTIEFTKQYYSKLDATFEL